MFKQNRAPILLLGGFLTISVFGFTAFSFAQESNFKDVKLGDKYYNEIKYLRDKGISSGYADGEFKEDKEISRGEFLKLVINSKFDQRVIDKCTKRYGEKNQFKDVPNTNKFSGYICVGKEFGIVNGYTGGTEFKPEDNITYAEASKIVVRALSNTHLDSTNLTPYTDFMESMGITPPTLENYSLKGQVKIKRGEMAYLIQRFKVKLSNLDDSTTLPQFMNLDGLISGEKAIEIARGVVGADAKLWEMELKMDNGKAVFKIEMGNNKVMINAYTGEVLQNVVEDSNADSTNHFVEFPKDIISSEEAKIIAAKALKVEAIDDMELKFADSRWVYQAEAKTGKVIISASSGEVIKLSLEMED